MYDASLKYKWDNKNVRDYEVSKGREEGREEERSKALEDKREIALELKRKGLDLDFIAKTTKLSLEEIQGLG